LLFSAKINNRLNEIQKKNTTSISKAHLILFGRVYGKTTYDMFKSSFQLISINSSG
jgi:hypothetical protein